MGWYKEEAIARRLHKTGKVTAKEYATLYRGCKKISTKVYHQKKMGSIIYNPVVRQDVLDDITTMSLVKALKGYRPSKRAAFMSYFYNKARSYTRVQQGKMFRRFNLINASSLNDEVGTEND